MSIFENKVVVVTGGGSGIGAAICRLAAEQRAQVVVADIDLPAAEQVAADIRESGGGALAAHVDITSTASAAALAALVQQRFGACHMLFANAGVLLIGALQERSEQDWHWVFEVNVHGTVRTVDAFLPLLKQQAGNAHIVITGSMAGFLASAPAKGVYNASKHAQIAYAETLRDELASESINVALLAPGGTQSRIVDSGRNRSEEFGASKPVAASDIHMIIETTGTTAPPVTPEYCIRGLIDGLERKATWIIADSSQREKIENRFRAVSAAFDYTDRFFGE